MTVTIGNAGNRGKLRLIAAALAAGVILTGARSMSGTHAQVPGVAERTLANPNFRWVHRRTTSANVYVLAGSAAAPSLSRISSESEAAVRANLEWLGVRSAGRRLNLFFVGSRDEMRPFTGNRALGSSVVGEGAAFFVANDSIRPPLRHEIMHLLSWRLWGPPGGVWLSEGLATAAVGGCNEWSLDEIAAALYRDRQLATISELRRRFRNGGREGAAHYVSAASLILFIDREFGRDRTRRLWSQGLRSVTDVLGVSALTLEQRWRSAVSADSPAPVRWSAVAAEINREGCE
jgi:hypothetical protein